MKMKKRQARRWSAVLCRCCDTGPIAAGSAAEAALGREEHAETHGDRNEEQETGETRERPQAFAKTHDRRSADQEGCDPEEHQLDEPRVLRRRPHAHAEQHDGRPAQRDVGRERHVRVHELGVPQDDVGVRRCQAEDETDEADRNRETVHGFLSKDDFRDSHGGVTKRPPYCN